MKRFLLHGIKTLKKIYAIFIIGTSNLFDKAWYLDKNRDVPSGKISPYLHYLNFGGFEGRDPSPKFNSSWYLDTYQDVKEAEINPLLHYLRFGKKEGRTTFSPQSDTIVSQFKCPVCRKGVDSYLPLSTFYIENLKKHGYQYSFDESETINVEQYSCPHCGASDRDRLYACYLEEKLRDQSANGMVSLLDIAPSAPLSEFIRKFENVDYKTADLLIDGVDFSIDITYMPEVASDTYDILICSHVLEHVKNDRQALSELYRVLKPGGWGIIMVPINLTIDHVDEDPELTDPAERWRRFGQDDHVRLHSKFGFIERVRSAGFNLKQLGMNYFGETVFRTCGITRQSVLYVAEKRQDVNISPVKRECEFFFVVGTGRSGTTLMAQVLNAHSKICVPFELQIVCEENNNGARLAEVFGSKRNLTFQAEDYSNLVKERCPYELQDFYDYRAFFNRCDYPILSLQWVLTELYTDIAYSQGKSIFAEQTPWYGQHIKLLDQIFPQAKFLHLVRDGRDVAISFSRTPWWHHDVHLNLERWKSEIEKIEEDGLHLSEGRLLTIRYEDLISTPETIIQNVCDFLNVPFEQTMLDPQYHVDYIQFSKYSEFEKKNMMSAAYQSWKKVKKSAFFSDNVYGWKNNNEFHFDNIDEPIKQTLEQFGYEV